MWILTTILSLMSFILQGSRYYMLLIRVLGIRLANSFKTLVQSIPKMPLKRARLIHIWGLLIILLLMLVRTLLARNLTSTQL
jgi:hypothetical protein